MNYVAQCRQVRISKAFGFNFFNFFNSLKNLFNSPCIPALLHLYFPAFPNKASLLSKQGFLAAKTRLVWRVKKPCLQTRDIVSRNAPKTAWR